MALGGRRAVEEQYPDAVQILDYFHAKEKLCEFAKEAFCDEQQRNEWIGLPPLK